MVNERQNATIKGWHALGPEWPSGAVYKTTYGATGEQWLIVDTYLDVQMGLLYNWDMTMSL